MRRVLITGFILAIFMVGLYSQSLPIKNYTTQDGLLQNQVMSILQDSKGFIWFRTQAGLSKFDGYDFTNLNINSGLPSNQVNNFFENEGVFYLLGDDFVSIVKNDKVIKNFDKEYFSLKFSDEVARVSTYYDTVDAYIYAFSNTAIYVLDIKETDFVKGYEDINLPEQFTENTVISIVKEDLLYLSMQKDGYFIDLKDKKVVPVLSKLNLPINQTVLTQIITLDESKKHYLHHYVNNQSHQYIYTIFNIDDFSFKRLYESKSLTLINEKKDDGFYNAVNDKNEYLVLDEKGQVLALDFDNQKVNKTEMKVFSPDIDLSKVNDTFLMKDKLFVLTRNGLVEYGLTDKVTHFYSVQNGFSSINLQKMFIDREANIWVGTNGSGVDMIVTSNVTNYTDKNGLSNSGTTNTVVGDDGSIWVTTDYGLSRIMPDGEVKVYNKKDGLQNLDCWGLGKDINGNIWIGTIGGGIYLYKDGKIKNMFPEDVVKFNDYTIGFFMDSEGNIWIPAIYGFLKYDKNYKYEYFPFEAFTIIYTIFEDKDGNLWTAGGKKSIDIYNKKGKIIKSYPIDDDVFHSSVVSMEQISENILWISTYGEGLIEFNIKENSFKKIFEKDLKGSELIKASTKDKLGNIWLGTINGVFKINKANLVTRFSQEDGLIGNDIRTSGAYCDEQGILWFNSTFGLIRINPYEEYLDHKAPIVYVTEFSTKKPVDIEKQNFVFKYNDNSANFKFVGVEFRNPNRVLYQYFLVGFDPGWSNFTTERNVRYTNLNPGVYRFMVRAKDNAGNMSEAYTLSFRILAPFWKTLWFRLIIVFLLAIIVYLFIHWRINVLSRKNQELEEEVKERTKELQEKTDQLISSIRYAKRIQTAILPQESFLKEHFPETFILYKPRDIIAGDYYWFTEVHGYTFLAVADCTGHGVPGALLSIVGNMLLNEIINKYDVYEPSTILEYLHESVRTVLCQNEEDSHFNDGMEVSLCRFNKEYTELVYSGANRPLYFVRNHRLQQVNGDRKGIGGKQREDKRIFTSQVITLEQNDMLYLTTDGYVDQANPQDKKFGSRRLKHLLQYVSDKDSTEQLKILLDNFNTHSENEPQRDDVTIIGVRIEIKGS